MNFIIVLLIPVFSTWFIEGIVLYLQWTTVYVIAEPNLK